jgi:transposase-like protein
MALDMKGHKDILGIWVGEQEGAKFWISVCNDLKNRGVKDILIACMAGLKGLPDAVKVVFLSVSIQSCIIHQVRNSIKYIASKNYRTVHLCYWKRAQKQKSLKFLRNTIFHRKFILQFSITMPLCPW